LQERTGNKIVERIPLGIKQKSNQNLKTYLIEGSRTGLDTFMPQCIKSWLDLRQSGLGTIKE
jgi:hypothetical protein